MLVMIVIFFFLFWTPRLLYEFIVAINAMDGHQTLANADLDLLAVIKMFAIGVSYINSVVNAPIYYPTSK